jgi:hypothetical protein
MAANRGCSDCKTHLCAIHQLAPARPGAYEIRSADIALAIVRRAEKENKPLRVRYVGDGQHCAACGKVFYPARTISGRITENYCSGECAAVAMRTRREPWRDEGGEA